VNPVVPAMMEVLRLELLKIVSRVTRCDFTNSGDAFSAKQHFWQLGHDRKNHGCLNNPRPFLSVNSDVKWHLTLNTSNNYGFNGINIL
jgi:hypothetical protein